MIAETYALSPMQQGMLFHHLLGTEPGVDVVQIVCELPEALESAAFRLAWERVVRRHPALRTAFRWEGLPAPCQEVHDCAAVPWTSADWRGLAALEQQQRYEAYLAADLQRGFDLTCPPLMRLALFRLGQAVYRWVWTVHHLVTDGGSWAIILREVLAHYEAIRQGTALHLGATRPFRDHITNLMQYDRGADEVFWRQLLHGFNTPTPLGHWQSSTDSSTGAVHRNEQEIRLSATATAALQELARQHRFSLGTIVHGAWALLLAYYSGEDEVVFGSTLSERPLAPEGSEETVGMFITTLPVRVHVAPEAALIPWLQAFRQQQRDIRAHQRTPLLDMQRWCGLPPRTALFDSIVIYDHASLETTLRAGGGSLAQCTTTVLQQPPYPLRLYAYGEAELLLKLEYDPRRFDNAAIHRMLGHLQTVLTAMAAVPDCQLKTLPFLTETERDCLLVAWNNTATTTQCPACVHTLIEGQVARTPEAVAVVWGNRALTYQELNARANQLAHYLRKLGVGPDVLVGLCVQRSLDMVVALLGIHKAGGAYVPLDPTYPRSRLAFMLTDANVPVLLTQESLLHMLPAHGATVVRLDADWPAVAQEPATNLAIPVEPESLAYVIYTSGSTGNPKGVMVEHRNVSNFFTAMDPGIAHTPPGTWLAVTSLSFDIAVLELLWTLARGFKVVLHSASRPTLPALPLPSTPGQKPLEFSVFYFASDASQNGRDKYRLLKEGAQFADRHGFTAVWTPERHFHAFGGLYPNPSVTSAAIAAMTERVQIRAGSVVLPLHDPIRVAEEWAVVDNLSNGRVGISFAAGWHPDDFVLKPEHYPRAKDVMRRDIETVRQLWRGEKIIRSGGTAQEVEVRTLPRPVQPELPVWLTAAGNPATFRLAGELGANLLTHLLGQNLEELTAKIQLYRQAWREHGHGPGDGHVTLMLHTYLGEDESAVRAKVRQPMMAYLQSSLDLVKAYAWSFPAFKHQPTPGNSTAADDGFSQLSDAEVEALVAHAFERYYETSGLFGTPASCARRIAQIRAMGVDEVACLIDFGLAPEDVLQGLEHLNTLKQRTSQPETVDNNLPSLPEAIATHGVTHLQCTPSMASMLLMEPRARQALGLVQHMFVGGEALPAGLAAELSRTLPGNVLNMYGPTETTVWSSTYTVRGQEDVIPIGRPIANTEFYVLDRQRRPVPIGVPGELYIGGAGVVRGYLHRPELTAERFMAHPFRADPTVRLYRTGDLVRYRADGVIEFLGRMDHQVKIRGYRIELGEIEALLAQHAVVREAVVVAREDIAGDKQLVAYVVAEDSQQVQMSQLRDYLKDRLPEFMVPAHFVELDALPLTPNAKIDRRALPAPERVLPVQQPVYTPPETILEQTLAAIWQDVLHVPKVGMHENFFDLGGHSLLTVQVLGSIRERLGRELALTDLFRFPTIRALSQYLSQAENRPSTLKASQERASARRELMQRRLERCQPR